MMLRNVKKKKTKKMPNIYHFVEMESFRLRLSTCTIHCLQLYYLDGNRRITTSERPKRVCRVSLIHLYIYKLYNYKHKTICLFINNILNLFTHTAALMCGVRRRR